MYIEGFNLKMSFYSDLSKAIISVITIYETTIFELYLGETKYEKTKTGYGQFVKDIQTCLLCVAIETG